MTKRKCGHCGATGHNITTCPILKQERANTQVLEDLRSDWRKERRERERLEQTWALVELVNSMATDLGVTLYLDVDIHGGVYTETSGHLHLEDAAAVHAVMGAIEQARKNNG